MKYHKLIGLALCFCMLVGSAGAVGASVFFPDIDSSAPYAGSADLLKTLGVITGDPDGNFRPDDSLTRAEFAKVAVYVLGKQNEAMSNSGTSAFSDLRADHWALKYINYAVKNALILGYPDGTFHPEENLSYAQAITISLRMLGYATKDVGSFWPDNYIQKAAALGLTDGLVFSPSDVISRGNMALILGRLFETEINPGVANGVRKTPLDVMGYTVIDETPITATQQNDKSLSADQIKTGDGIYKTLVNVDNMLGSTVKLYLDDQKRVVMASPVTQYTRRLTVKKNLDDNKYACIDENGSTEYAFEDAFPIYYEGNKTTFAAVKQNIAPGAQVLLKGKYDGRWDYALLLPAPHITPVIAVRDMQTGDNTIGSITIANPDLVTVYRDGLAARFVDIKRYDVVYYNPVTNTMDVYADKVTGIYDKAFPSKAYVTSIELGGKTYQIETAQATAKLDESAGSFKIGDRVTLLLGKDGKIAGVANITNNASLDYGVLTSTVSAMAEDGDNKGELEYFANIFMGDGNTYKYKTVKDYSNYKGALVRLSFADGLLSLSPSNAPDLAGSFNKENRTINGKSIAEGAVLFDLVSNNAGQAADVITIRLSDLTQSGFYLDDILDYAVSVGFDDIGVILFNNITSSATQYGIVVSSKTSDANSMNISGTYTVDIRGAQSTFSGNVIYSVNAGEPVRLELSGGKLTKMTALAKVDSASSVDAVDYNRIRVNGIVYPMDENVVIYKKKPDTVGYITIQQSELTSDRIASVELYSDGSVKAGGKVRVIKVTYAFQ